MLAKLDIQNFAIIKDLQVDFKGGFTALIGETGAGKSILIDALAILLGSRASTDFIRTGSDSSKVTGQFEVESELLPFIKTGLEKYGLPELDGNTLLFQREISIKGRNTVRVNGQLTTINALAELGQSLVDIHGQSDQQILMDELAHVTLLDRFGAEQLGTLLADYRTHFEAYSETKRKLNQVTKNVQEIAQKKDILTFQINEIEEAKIEDGEEDARVDDELNRLDNYQKTLETANAIQAVLESEEQNVVDPVGSAMNDAQSLAELSHEYQGLADSLSDAYYALDDARSRVQDLLDTLDFDEEHYQYLLERSSIFGVLKKKYGPTLADVLDFYEKSAAELSSFNDSDYDVKQLNKVIAEEEIALKDLGKKIHQTRLKVAKKLEQRIKEQLRDLYMEKAEFAVSIVANKEFYPNGQDDVKFLISPNPGEDLKPLVKIASGGEQSRIMLALKVIFGQLSRVQTMIFDEIDTGVSGRVASAIGQKMLELAKSKQVLTITHAPQVSAIADQRFLINKTVTDNQTYTELTPLDDETSVEAIAKMIAGNKLTDSALKNAADLLDRKNN